MKSTVTTTKTSAKGAGARAATLPALAAPRAAGVRVAIVVSAYHSEITGALLEGARHAHHAAGGLEQGLVVVAAPGAFELPLLAAAAAARVDIAGVVALGCVVRGQTRHDRYISSAVAAELARIAVASGKPVGLGLLTVENLKQARARAGGRVGNKGAETMEAVLRALGALAELRASGGVPAAGARA